MGDDVKGSGAPSAKSLSQEGYNQTYVIFRADDEDAKISSESNDVFFRCGNWCYKGIIQFIGLKISTSDLPALIPILQRQQGSLRYFCTAKTLSSNPEFYDPVDFVNECTDFLAKQVSSESVEEELVKMSSVFPWINDESSKTYFELTLRNLPAKMKDVGLVASKTYTRGLIIISIFHENTIYCVIQSGEGDQALLDVRFPDVSMKGQGVQLGQYDDKDSPFDKLSLWHNIDEAPKQMEMKQVPKLRTTNVTNTTYQQTYCIMESMSKTEKTNPNLSVHHDVLFRFGTWCYAGRVQLTPSLTLADIPFVIPALRMQQSRLDFVFDTSNIPTNSPFAPCLEYMHSLEPKLDTQIAESEDALTSLIDRLGKMGLGESIARWLEGDSQNSFFEFKLLPDEEMKRALKNMELVASKTYHASGIVTITVVFQDTIYVSLLDASTENPLLDSRFPDVSGKGRGYQVHSYPLGAPDWPALRKVSVWQTIAALEAEFRERAAALAQAKTADDAAETSSNPGGGYGYGQPCNTARSATDDMFDSAMGSPRSQRSGLGLDIDEESEPEVKVISQEKGVAGDTKPETQQRKGDSDGGSGGSAATGVATGTVGDAVASQAPVTTPMKAEEKSSPQSNSISGTKSTSEEAGPTKDEGAPSGQGIESNAYLSTSAPATSSTSTAASGKNPLSIPLNVTRARPHHLPRNENLNKRLEELKRQLGDTTDSAAPWDAQGKPLNMKTKLTSPSAKK